MRASKIFIIHFTVLFILAIDFILAYFFRRDLIFSIFGLIFASFGVLNIFLALILKLSGMIVDDVSVRPGARSKIVMAIISIIAIFFVVLYFIPDGSSN